MTKMMRSGTYGSAHKEEDTHFAHNCKSLPIPTFVSKTPRHQRLFSIVTLCTQLKVWKTTACPRVLLILHRVVWEKGCCFGLFSICYFFGQENGWFE